MSHNTSKMRSTLSNHHYAGTGILEDDYSETSGGKRPRLTDLSPSVKFVTDKFDPRTMNGPVIIVQEGKKKHD